MSVTNKVFPEGSDAGQRMPTSSDESDLGDESAELSQRIHSSGFEGAPRSGDHREERAAIRHTSSSVFPNSAETDERLRNASTPDIPVHRRSSHEELVDRLRKRLEALWNKTELQIDDSTRDRVFASFLRWLDPTAFRSPAKAKHPSGLRPLFNFATMPEAILLFRQRLREVAQETSRLKVLVEQALPSLLLDAEEGGIGTREEHCDIALSPLATRPANRDTDNLRSLLRHIRGYIDGQPADARGHGFYQTCAGLGDVLLQPRRPALPEAIVYYHEVASHYHRIAVTQGGLDEGGRERVRNVLNNMVLAVMRHLDNKDSLDSISSIKDLAKAAAAMTLAVDRSTWNHHTLSVLLGEAAEIAACMDAAARLGSVWQLSPEADALLDSAAACAVLGNPAASRRAPALLFNSSVALLRGQRSAQDDDVTSDRENALRGRALLAGLGLAAAFELSDLNDVEALVEMDGISCAVNMLGAVSSMRSTRESGARRQAIHAFGSFILGMEQRTPGLDVSYERMRGSLGELELNATPRTPEKGELRKAASAVLDILVEEARGESEVDDHRSSNWRAETARRIRLALLHICGEEKFLAARTEIIKVAEELRKCTEDADEAFVDAYKGLAAPAWGQPGQNPVASVIQIPDWQSLVAGCRVPTQSLGLALSSIKADWWDRGEISA